MDWRNYNGAPRNGPGNGQELMFDAEVYSRCPDVQSGTYIFDPSIPIFWISIFFLLLFKTQKEDDWIKSLLLNLSVI